MAASLRKQHERQEVVALTNQILNQLHCNLDIQSFEDITPHVFLEIFEGLTGQSLLGSKKPAVLTKDKIHNCQLILSKLSEIVGVSLDHISASALVNGNAIAIFNVIEIFCGLMEQLMDSIASESDELLNDNLVNINTDTISVASSKSEQSIEEFESKFPNICSIVGLDRAASYLTSGSSPEGEFEDPELESLLNVDIEEPFRGRNKSPINKILFSDTPAISIRPRKVARMPAVKSPVRTNINIRAHEQHRRLYDSNSSNGMVLDRSNYKATFADLKTDLRDEKATLEKRLNAVKNRYKKAEFAAKIEVGEMDDSLNHRKDVIAEEIPINALSNYGKQFVGPRVSRKSKTNSFSRVGFLSKTIAEKKKKIAVKRLCSKYHNSPDSTQPSPTTTKDMIGRLKVHFPNLELDDATTRRLWTEYSRHIQALGRVADSARAATRSHHRESAMAQAERQQQILLSIVRKETAQAKRYRYENERKRDMISNRNNMEDSKIQRIRSQRYYNEFVEQARARLANKQFGEEMIFRNVFREAVLAQKQRLLDLASTAREVAAERNKEEAMKAAKMRSNFQEKLHLLNEGITTKRCLVEKQEKEQAVYLNKMRREMRSKLESELRGVQSQMVSNFKAERIAFRELDAEAVKMQIYAESKQTRPFLK